MSNHKPSLNLERTTPKVEDTLRPCLVPKNFQDSPSHRIFGHMHRALNVVLKNNQLHSLVVIDEMNLMSLINL